MSSFLNQQKLACVYASIATKTDALLWERRYRDRVRRERVFGVEDPGKYDAPEIEDIVKLDLVVLELQHGVLS